MTVIGPHMDAAGLLGEGGMSTPPCLASSTRRSKASPDASRRAISSRSASVRETVGSSAAAARTKDRPDRNSGREARPETGRHLAALSERTHRRSRARAGARRAPAEDAAALVAAVEYIVSRGLARARSRGGRAGDAPNSAGGEGFSRESLDGKARVSRVGARTAVRCRALEFERAKSRFFPAATFTFLARRRGRHLARGGSVDPARIVHRERRDDPQAGASPPGPSLTRARPDLEPPSRFVRAHRRRPAERRPSRGSRRDETQLRTRQFCF